MKKAEMIHSGNVNLYKINQKIDWLSVRLAFVDWCFHNKDNSKDPFLCLSQIEKIINEQLSGFSNGD